MEIINKTENKNIRIFLKWRELRINFGTLDFKEDGSLIFAWPFYGDTEKYPTIETGDWDEKTKITTKDKTMKNNKGFHVSLHPRDNIIHTRQKDEANEDLTIERKKLNWFPVTDNFIFIRTVSPPMDECSTTAKTAGFDLEIPAEYKNSVETLVRVWPRDIKEIPTLEGCIGNVCGYCPNYWVSCDFILTDMRSCPAILWPKD
jgi:hypothetical protein